MKRKTTFGIWILILLSLLPIIPWYFLGPTKIFDYENITHYLGQISALVGMTMFAITFLLSTRLKIIEKFLGGLDKVYVVHTIFGSSSFVLLLLHPILLVLKYVPSRIDLASKYLLPGHGLSVDFGIIALLGMIILLVITFYINIKYNYWKMSHKFLGLFFIFAVLHIFLVRGVASRDYIFKGYYVYAFIVSAIGLIAFFYTLFFKNINLSKYIVKSIEQKGKLFDIIMEPINKPLKYEPGQFAFFRFNSLGREFHPFSIASNDNELRIIVKHLGDYTKRIKNIKLGDDVLVEGPYGEFTIKNHSDMIWLASGIGITPFIGMAKELGDKKATLYYCVRHESELVLYNELQSYNNLKVIPWCSSNKGRISIHNIKVNKNQAVYICGSKEFKDSFIEALLKQGISKENIYEEDFLFK